MVGCSVIGCKNRTEIQGNLQYHRFPVKNVPVAVKWNMLCVQSNQRDLSKAKNKRICGDHFQNEDYEMNSDGIRTLRAGAIPRGTTTLTNDYYLWSMNDIATRYDCFEVQS